jgi:MerR family Zn(II)-responsive transcriptional regulator of zntA
MNQPEHKRFFQIGEIAEKAGTSARTVRYYMESGFIEPEGRTPGGFYLFSAEAADTVFFVKKLNEAGLHLKAVQAMYRARQSGETGDAAYPNVLAHLEAQKALVSQKIADYRRLEREIEDAMDLVRECDGCQRKPCRENCETCPVVASREKIPLPFQAIL